MSRTKAFDPEHALAQAERLFTERGFEAVSVQNLVDTLGISRSSLYSTFGDKQQLYLTALDRYLRRAGGTMQTDLNLSSPLAGIRRYLDRVVEEAEREGGDRGCFMTNATIERAPNCADTSERALQSRRALVAAFEHTLRRAQRAGEIDDARDARALARFLATTVYGLRTLARTRPDPGVMTDVVDTAMGTLES